MVLMIPPGFYLGIGNAGAGNTLLTIGIYLSLVLLVSLTGIAWAFTSPQVQNTGTHP